MASVGNNKETSHGEATELNNSTRKRKKMNSEQPIVQIQPIAINDSDSTPKGSNGNSSSGGSRSGSFLLVCFFGIFISYFIYGLLQEKITKRKFGGEYFRFFLFMVLVQCIINALFARVVCSVRKLEVSLSPYNLFTMLSFTYVAAMVSSNSSLNWISYPTQVLGKSAKPIPILLLGVLIGGKQYPRIKYLVVLLIVAGVALFLYKEGGGPGTKSDQHKFMDTIGFGELLVLLSLLLDGLTGILQDKLRASYDISAYHMMYAVNVFSAVYLSAAVILSGELWRVTAFIQTHPTVLLNIGAFSVASAIGQNFIFLTVTNFGPLTTSIITTTRKFFTILASVIIFSNPVHFRQWIGVFLVFLGLGIDVYFGKTSKK